MLHCEKVRKRPCELIHRYCGLFHKRGFCIKYRDAGLIINIKILYMWCPVCVAMAVVWIRGDQGRIGNEKRGIPRLDCGTDRSDHSARTDYPNWEKCVTDYPKCVSRYTLLIKNRVTLVTLPPAYKSLYTGFSYSVYNRIHSTQYCISLYTLYRNCAALCYATVRLRNILFLLVSCVACVTPDGQGTTPRKKKAARLEAGRMVGEKPSAAGETAPGGHGIV